MSLLAYIGLACTCCDSITCIQRVVSLYVAISTHLETLMSIVLVGLLALAQTTIHYYGQ